MQWQAVRMKSKKMDPSCEAWPEENMYVLLGARYGMIIIL